MTNSVGEQLRNAREAKHLTLEQVARSTFIKLKFLEALEDDRFEDLHTAVQTRGFIRIYAELLDLPAGPLLDLWEGRTSPTDNMPANDPTRQEIGYAAPSQDQPISTDRFLVEEDFTPPMNKPAPAADVDVMTPPMAGLTSGEIFAGIGQVLKKRRENLKISHEDIEKFVHIRPKYLQALEEGRIDDLPSTVQGRGMLSNYAHFLEVDNSYLQTRFAEGLQLRRSEMAPPEKIEKRRKPAAVPAQEEKAGAGDKPPRRASSIKRFLTPDLLIAVPLIIFLLGFSVWALFEVLSKDEPIDQVQAPNISEVLLETSIPPTSIAGTTTSEPTSVLAQEATQMAGTQQVETEVLPTAEQPVGDQPLNINIVARQSAWLQVTVGKSVVFNGRVVPGNAYPFSGNERIELLTGNAAALQVFYNGIDLGSLGLNNQVADLVFTLNGIITPTPRFSPTPTASPQATLTLQPTATPAAATVTPLIPVQ